MRRPILFPLLNIGKILQDELRAEYARHGISHGHARILRTLYRFGDLNQTKISLALHIKLPTVSRMLRDMEARRLISRRPDGDDVRVTRVSLTAKGRKAAHSVWDICSAIETRLKGFIGASNILIFRSQLTKIREGLGGKRPNFDILKND